MGAYYCYLLKSIKNKSTTATYIGFTKNPTRRIKQHNGEIASGAKRTARSRPWEFVCIVSGFPNQRVALKFEFMWTYPQTSRITKGTFGSRIVGWKRRLDVLLHLLSIPLWEQMNLRVHFFREETRRYFLQNEISPVVSKLEVSPSSLQTKPPPSRPLTSPTASCVSCHISLSDISFSQQLRPSWVCEECASVIHLSCLASFSLQQHSSSSPSSSAPLNALFPRQATCPTCNHSVPWIDVARQYLSESMEEEGDDEEVEGKEEDDAFGLTQDQGDEEEGF